MQELVQVVVVVGSCCRTVLILSRVKHMAVTWRNSSCLLRLGIPGTCLGDSRWLLLSLDLYFWVGWVCGF